MKKLAALLLALLLFLAAEIALAQPKNAPYDMRLSIRYCQLTSAQQKLFDDLYDAVWNGKTEIELPKNTDYDEAMMLMDLLRKDMPELCAVNMLVTFHYYRNQPSFATGVTVSYDLHVNEQKRVVEAARQLSGSLRGRTVERELALHDRLCDRTEYAFGEHCHSAYGPLVDGQAVCEGYAKAFALLCRVNGIPCSVVEGDSIDPDGQWKSHAWNLVEVDGVMTWVDVTWDDQHETYHWYFNLTDALMAPDHRPDVAQTLPACMQETYEWYRMNGCVAPSGRGVERLYEVFARLARQGGTAELRFEDQTEFDRIVGSFSECWEAYNAQAQEGLYGRLTWNSRDTLRILSITRVE